MLQLFLWMAAARTAGQPVEPNKMELSHTPEDEPMWDRGEVRERADSKAVAADGEARRRYAEAAALDEAGACVEWLFMQAGISSFDCG